MRGGGEASGELSGGKGSAIFVTICQATKQSVAVTAVHEEYLVDQEGRRKAVVLPVNEWEQILGALEELEDIRTYDVVKSGRSERVPFEQAVQARRGTVCRC